MRELGEPPAADPPARAVAVSGEWVYEREG